MRNYWLVMREELRFHLTRWQTYVVYGLILLIMVGAAVLPRLEDLTADSLSLPDVETILDEDPIIRVPTGFVDEAGLILRVPDWQAENLRPYRNRTAAHVALATGQITGYYIIPADYVEIGRLIHVSPEAQLMANTDRAMELLLQSSVLALIDDPQLSERLRVPVRLDVRGPAPIEFFSGISSEITEWKLVVGFVVLLYFNTLLAGLMAIALRAFTREVEEDMLEVVATSTSGLELVVGKLLGGAVLASGQLLGALPALVFFFSPWRTTSAEVRASLPSGLILTALPNPAVLSQVALPLVLVAVPALLLGGLAASAAMILFSMVWADDKTLSGVQQLFALLTQGLVFAALFAVAAPNGSVTTALTFFPITAPVMLTARAVLGVLPAGQALGGLLMLAGWAVGWVWLAARLFRAHPYLIGQVPTLKIVAEALWR